MNFVIKSSESDACLTFSELNGDYFKVKFMRSSVSIEIEVYAYTDSQGLNLFFQDLSKTSIPSKQPYTWQSLEGEFNISANCSNLGHVNLLFEMSALSGAYESILFKSGIVTDYGLLKKIAADSDKFFA